MISSFLAVAPPDRESHRDLLQLMAELVSNENQRDSLYLAGDGINQLQEDFSNRVSDVISWYVINRLDINWKKTFAMITTYKRVMIQMKL